MQKIDGLLPPKSISITEDQDRHIKKRMEKLGFKKLSEFIRFLIKKDMNR